MLTLTDETKFIYEQDGIHKDMRVYFPDLDLTYTNERIVSGTFKMTESIASGDNVEFIGCIATSFSIELAEVNDNIVDQKIEVYIVAEGTEEIPLFKGIVDSAQKQTYKNHKLITAYDMLYSLSKRDISTWYNNHPRTTVEKLFDDLVLYLDLDVAEVSWINGSLPVYCSESQMAESLSALDLIKSICQINGVFGRINRDGLFETLSLDMESPASFVVKHHEEVWHEDYTVHPIESVIIRDASSDGGVNYTETQFSEGYIVNEYVIQGNIFATDWNTTQLMTAAQNIFSLISKVTFIPFEADTYGLPFVECGDQVIFEDVDLSDLSSTQKYFYVLTRTLSGINGMRDNFTAESEEKYLDYTSKINTNISSIKSQMGEYNLLALKYQNPYLLTVDETKEVRFSKIDYSTSVSRPFFLAELLLDVIPNQTTQTLNVTIDGVSSTLIQNVDIPVEVSVRYVLNDEEIVFYPKETYTAGKHILNLIYFLGNLEDVGTFEGFITVTGGTVIIQAGDAISAIIGQGKISAAVEWNGIIEVSDTVHMIPIEPMNVVLPKESHNFEIKMALLSNMTAAIPLMNVEPMNIISVVDEIVINPVVTHYIFDTSKKNKYEYDDNSVRADDTYALATEFIIESEEQSIDTGKMYVIDIDVDKTQFASIDSIEIRSEIDE